MSIIEVVSILIFSSLCAAIFELVRVIIKQARVINELADKLDKAEKSNKSSLDKSRSVVKGQISEQLFPLKADCPFELSDMKFFGQPMDYIVLDGYSEGSIKEIIFVEVKTGRANLSSIQRSLRDCIDAKRVRWQTIRIKEDNQYEHNPIL